jgi:hypothetical protein
LNCGPTRSNRRRTATTAAALLVLAVVMALRAADPEIYLVEHDPHENWILLHFNTEPNLSYTVQRKDSLLATQWTTYQFIPAFPFSNHYVVTDYLTNSQRYYRLLVQ